MGKLSLMVGPLLLMAGGAASMGLTGIYADVAMGVSLLGLVLTLTALHRGDRTN